MDNEYEIMFKQLMNERNELRKYIIDICELLGIDTSQSVLGANCLEFYAVLCSTTENKIKDLQEQLKLKEQELRNICRVFDIEYIIDKETGSLIGRCNKLNKKEQECEEYKQALDEIKEIAKEQVPYLNIDKAKTMIEIEYDYAGKIYNLQQRMYKILQKISECETEND